MLKVYTYVKCDSCRKAIRFLTAKGISFKLIPIRETPPSKNELQRMLKSYEGEMMKLFNTSGEDYRTKNIKAKLPSLNQEQIWELLTKNGNLVKRPFVIGDNFGLVGFKPDQWEKFFDKETTVHS
jgi:arsenate reductase (glutaredoxin)